MESKELILRVAEALDAKKAADIMVIDIAEKSSFADYFLLASGRNERQIAGLADEAEDCMAKMEMAPKSIEGKATSGWILMIAAVDFFCHVGSPYLFECGQRSCPYIVVHVSIYAQHPLYHK